MTTIAMIDMDTIRFRETSQRSSINGETVDDLADSITRLGLMNPITVALAEDGTTELIAGEHRLRALQSLSGSNLYFNETPIPAGKIPCVVYSMPSVLKKFEIELEENTKRVNLTWQEQATAMAKLKELTTLRTSETPSKVDLSDLTPRSPGAVADDLFLSDFLADPAVIHACTR